MSDSERLKEMLASYPEGTQKLVKETRSYLIDVIPGVIEIIEKKENLIGYGFGPGYKDTICSLMPTKSGITMGIGWGTELPDPEKILEGSGKIHRHVKLKQLSDLEKPALKTLLLEVVAHWKTKRKK
jgi:hypothetical protein